MNSQVVEIEAVLPTCWADLLDVENFADLEPDVRPFRPRYPGETPTVDDPMAYLDDRRVIRVVYEDARFEFSLCSSRYNYVLNVVPSLRGQVIAEERYLPSQTLYPGMTMEFELEDRTYRLTVNLLDDWPRRALHI